MTSPSEAALQGIRADLRLEITHPPEARYDEFGAELLQIRGKVLDSSGTRHPPVVARFGGQHRSELWKWARIGKQLALDGALEIKHYTSTAGQLRIFLLVHAQNIYPLSDVEDNSKIGVYALGGESTRRRSVRAPGSRQDATALLRSMLEKADA